MIWNRFVAVDWLTAICPVQSFSNKSVSSDNAVTAPTVVACDVVIIKGGLRTLCDKDNVIKASGACYNTRT